jgi:hypothetical protein
MDFFIKKKRPYIIVLSVRQDLPKRRSKAMVLTNVVVTQLKKEIFHNGSSGLPHMQINCWKALKILIGQQAF